MSRKSKARAIAAAPTQAPAAVKAVAVDRSKFPEHTCGSCRSCTVRNTGYCGNRKTVDALDGWDRVVVHVGRFGCVNWEKL